MTKQVSATWEFSGLSDYWSGNGRRWDDDAGCVFAFVGPNTTYADLIDGWMDDNSGDFDGKEAFDDVSDDDLRAAFRAIFVDDLDMSKLVDIAKSMRVELGHNDDSDSGTSHVEVDGYCETCADAWSDDGGDSPIVIALVEVSDDDEGSDDDYTRNASQAVGGEAQ